ncbi:MAG: hypothetical protein AAF487_12435 [Bacteroidota bacterium]
MKKIKLYAYFLLSTLLVSSCGNIQEEIYINEDYSGSYQVSYDVLDGMTQMMKGFALMLAEKDGKSIDMDSLNQAMRNELWEDFPDEIDSVIDISEKMSEESNPIIEKYGHLAQMKMIGSKAEDKLDMIFKIEFTEESGLKEYFKDLSQMNDDKDIGNDLGLGESSAFVASLFSQNGSVYEMSEKGIKRAGYDFKDDKKSSDKDLQKAMEKMGNLKVTTIIHVPKKIKKLKGKGIRKEDDNTVILEYELSDLLSGKNNGAFEVIYKN